MNKHHRREFLFLFILCLASCGSNPPQYYPLPGSWKGLAKTTGNTATITFDSSGNYTFNNSKTQESGTYVLASPNITFQPSSGSSYVCTYSTPIETELVMTCPSDGYTFNKLPGT